MPDTRASRSYYRSEAIAFAVHAVSLTFFVGTILWLAINVRHHEDLWGYYLAGGICALISAVRAIQMLVRYVRSGSAPRRPRATAKARNALPADHRGWSVRMAEERKRPSGATGKIDPDSPLARAWAEEERKRHNEEVRRKGLSHRHLRK